MLYKAFVGVCFFFPILGACCRLSLQWSGRYLHRFNGDCYCARRFFKSGVYKIVRGTCALSVITLGLIGVTLRRPKGLNQNLPSANALCLNILGRAKGFGLRG